MVSVKLRAQLMTKESFPLVEKRRKALPVLSVVWERETKAYQWVSTKKKKFEKK